MATCSSLRGVTKRGSDELSDAEHASLMRLVAKSCGA